MPDYCLWNLCNSNCIMCTNPFGFRNSEDAKLYSADRVLARINSDKENITKTKEDINLTGGEPTIHPEFLYFFKKLRKTFSENIIAFSSNGRGFMYESFTKELLKINNIRLHIVVHSADKKVHEAITRSPGSFEQTVKGVENIFKYRNASHAVELRIVLLRQNYEGVNELYKFLYEKFPGVERVSTIFPEYEGRAEKNFNRIKITFPEVKPYVEKSIERWGSKFKNFYLYHFPLCVIDPKYWSHVIRSLPPDHHETFFMEKCDSCFYKDSCLGVYKDYVNYFGEGHFSPIEGEIAGVKKNHKDYHRPIIKKQNK